MIYKISLSTVNISGAGPNRGGIPSTLPITIIIIVIIIKIIIDNKK